MITASDAAKLLRASIKDYNYWGESESDTPLVVKRTKVMSQEKMLALDTGARKKASGEVAYVPPNRQIRQETLAEVFTPLIENSLTEVKTHDTSQGYEGLKMKVEALEYYVQLESVFQQLSDVSVSYVEDSSDPYTGMFITGKGSEGEYVFCQGLLIQT